MRIEAQTTNLKAVFGTQDDEIAQDFCLDENGNVFVAIAFERSFVLKNYIFNSKGGFDVCLFKYNLENGEIIWALQLGSPLDDEISHLEYSSESDELFLSGSYGLTLQLDTFILQSGANSKNSFLGNFSSDGKINWITPVKGTGINQITDFSIDNDGNLFGTGFFGSSLTMGEQTIVADGEINSLFFHLATDGTPLNLLHFRGKGIAKSTQIEIWENEIVISGTFNQEISLEDKTIFSNTGDLDIFTLNLSKNGSLNWLRKAGGVFDDRIGAISISQPDEIILFGDFIGVMALDSQISIQSKSTNPDLFLIGYDNKGKISRHKTFGNTAPVEGKLIVKSEDSFWLAGHYNGNLTMDGIQFSDNSLTNAYFVHLSPEFQILNHSSISSSQEGQVFIQKMLPQPQDKMLFLVNFSEHLNIGNFQLQGNSSFDVAILEVAFQVSTKTLNKNRIENDILFYPNPTKEAIKLDKEILIKKAWFTKEDGTTQLIKVSNDNSLDVGNLNSGIYFLTIETPLGLLKKKVVIIKD